MLSRHLPPSRAKSIRATTIQPRRRAVLKMLHPSDNHRSWPERLNWRNWVEPPCEGQSGRGSGESQKTGDWVAVLAVFGERLSKVQFP